MNSGHVRHMIRVVVSNDVVWSRDAGRRMQDTPCCFVLPQYNILNRYVTWTAQLSHKRITSITAPRSYHTVLSVPGKSAISWIQQISKSNTRTVDNTDTMPAQLPTHITSVHLWKTSHETGTPHSSPANHSATLHASALRPSERNASSDLNSAPSQSSLL